MDRKVKIAPPSCAGRKHIFGFNPSVSFLPNYTEEWESIRVDQHSVASNVCLLYSPSIAASLWSD